MPALTAYMVPTQEEIDKQALITEVRQLQKGDAVSGLGSQFCGQVVGVEQYKGKLEEYQDTTAVVIKGDGPDFQHAVFPSDTLCTLECLA